MPRSALATAVAMVPQDAATHRPFAWRFPASKPGQYIRPRPPRVGVAVRSPTVTVTDGGSCPVTAVPAWTVEALATPTFLPVFGSNWKVSVVVTDVSSAQNG